MKRNYNTLDAGSIPAESTNNKKRARPGFDSVDVGTGRSDAGVARYDTQTRSAKNNVLQFPRREAGLAVAMAA